jgi:hypothetical protein
MIVILVKVTSYQSLKLGGGGGGGGTGSAGHCYCGGLDCHYLQPPVLAAAESCMVVSAESSCC